MPHIAIIGNGISGITAARWIRKLSSENEPYQISVISSESEYFFSRTALMYVYMGHMRWKDIEPYEETFWIKNRIHLIHNKVNKINYTLKTLYCVDGQSIQYDKLILATGSKSNSFHWPGQTLQGVSGLYSKQDLEFCETMSRKIHHAAIIGGGLIGIELAEMFHSRNISVSLIVRESDYWSNVLPPEEARMVSNHIRQHGIDLRLETDLIEIHDDGLGHVGSITTRPNDVISCQFVGLTVGVSPNIEFLKGDSLECEKGILVNEFLETNIPDVYAIGDCAQLRQPSPGRRNIEAVWYTGRMMGETVAYNICNRKTSYLPGVWFNSAKFFDIEYQVYGTMPASIESPLDSFYWEAPQGNKSIRLVFDKESKKIKGFNVMGIRFRQEVCEQWITSETKLNDVMENIRLAFFDPEFFEDVAPQCLQSYNQQFNLNLRLKASNSLNAVLQFFLPKIKSNENL